MRLYFIRIFAILTPNRKTCPNEGRLAKVNYARIKSHKRSGFTINTRCFDIPNLQLANTVYVCLSYYSLK
jgi:hypothetical protein